MTIHPVRHVSSAPSVSASAPPRGDDKHLLAWNRANVEPLWAPRIYANADLARTDILGGRKALDIGCGGRKLPGAVGIDRLGLPGVDIIHDLDALPWPVADSCYDLVLANHFLEHVPDTLGTLGEIHRILKPGGRAVIQVPYFRSLDAVVDPTHVRFFASQSLDYVIEGSLRADYAYVPFRFRKVGFWYAWPQRSRNPLTRAFKAFIHAWPVFYDQYLSLIAPVICLTWELEKPA